MVTYNFGFYYDEGKKVDRFKYTGVDVKKNELPLKVKNYLKFLVLMRIRLKGGFLDY